MVIKKDNTTENDGPNIVQSGNLTLSSSSWALLHSFNNYHKLIQLLLLSFNVNFKDSTLCGEFLEACGANFQRCLKMKWWHSTSITIILGACMSCCCPTNKECGCYSLHKVFDSKQGSQRSWTHLCNLNTSYGNKVIQSNISTNKDSQIYNQRYWVESWGFNQHCNAIAINFQSTACSMLNPWNSQNAINDEDSAP